MKVLLHSLESASYCTDNVTNLQHLIDKLNHSFRSSLPTKSGLNVLPTQCSSLLLRAKKIKCLARKQLQTAAKYRSLLNKSQPGRKKQNWRLRNRVGIKIMKLKKV